jgi:microcystin-dependent protein
MYLKITENTGQGVALISDEKLNHVPYAIAANNGVPTGSIMPFLGTAAPEGWVLCDGSALPDGPLKDMIGAIAPDLQGMFLRGAGTNSFTSVTTDLKGTQDDSFDLHDHGKDLETNIEPNHKHAMIFKVEQAGGGAGTSVNYYTANGGDLTNQGKSTTDAGEHNHTISTEDKGGFETRPVNYGVNYIIKL